jgi:hypothetical protein
MTKDEALNHLKAVTEAFGPEDGVEFDQKAWSALRAAIKQAFEQPDVDQRSTESKETFDQPEPVAELESVLCDSSGKCCISGSDADCAIVDSALAALKKLPPKREWQGLTYGEVLEQKKDDPIQFYRAIEAKLKEKNA